MSLWQDIRLAGRLLVKDKWFTVVAALALALGIGVNTAVFTFANAVVLRGLPFTDPDSLVSIAMTDPRGRFAGVSRLDFLDWRSAAQSFSQLAMFTGASLNVSEQGRPAEQRMDRPRPSNDTLFSPGIVLTKLCLRRASCSRGIRPRSRNSEGPPRGADQTRFAGSRHEG